MEIRRLGPGDEVLARRAFETMAVVFDEDALPVSIDYVRKLLMREDFWGVVAMQGDVVVGGLTAHALPMTRSQATELFIYDIAVRADFQRRGVGRNLIHHLLSAAAAAGIDVSFVPAENEDTHAIDFYRAVGGIPSAVTFFTFERS